jgi:hypothetical protein
MDILQRLKSQKKDKDKGNVLSSIFDKKEKEEAKKDTEVDPDITHINKPKPEEKVVFREERVITRPQTFHSDGLREFDLESLKADDSATMKAACAQKVSMLIVDGKFEEAIGEITALEAKLAAK